MECKLFFFLGVCNVFIKTVQTTRFKNVVNSAMSGIHPISVLQPFGPTSCGTHHHNGAWTDGSDARGSTPWFANDPAHLQVSVRPTRSADV